MQAAIKSLLTWVLLSLAIPVFSQSNDKPLVVEEDPPLSVTNHSVRLLNGETLNYQATCGYLLLRNEQGESTAKIFFIAYTKRSTDNSKRPITFTFNGGPGSSSVWLHMGGLGPKRVLMTDKGEATSPPYQLVDNPYTWLEMTDLVFIDPVETGFSRPAKNVDKKEFTGFENDIKSVGAFIHLYTSRYARWSSPKYLAGESYGTTRAAGLSGHLQQRYGMYLNGLVMVSAITNFQTARFERGNDLPYMLFLPTYAAMAHYHGKIYVEGDLPAYLKQVEEFAIGEYSNALMKGDALPAAEFETIAGKLAGFTGLSESYIKQTNLRIHIRRFVKELRRDEGLTVGRLDGRMTGIDYDDAGEGYEYDPSYDATILGPYGMAINSHLKDNLNFSSDLPYEILTGRVRPWSYSNVENSYLNVSETLRGAMHRNQDLRVLICNGYYDLATPYFATDYTLNHMFLDPQLRDNVTMKYYQAGHMMYIHKASLEKLTQDVRDFYLSR
ncbi:MAG: peptidase S10 [Cyclobacteriaceae bacterium]|nr:peptidase S10 [Cyclobacteriaceae bacterium]